MLATARFIAELPGATTVNILPYHKLGITKYEMLDLSYPLDPEVEDDPERLGAYCEIIRENNPTASCSVGGGDVDYSGVSATTRAPRDSH